MFRRFNYCLLVLALIFGLSKETVLSGGIAKLTFLKRRRVPGRGSLRKFAEALSEGQNRFKTSDLASRKKW